MARPNTPLIIPAKSQLGIIEYHRQCYQTLANQWNIKEQMRAIDVAYIREGDRTKENARAKAANAYGNSNRFQNVTIPVVMPQVEAAVEYQTSVFLQGIPVFGVVSSPAYADEALQMETVIDENATRGGWVRHLQLFFRANFKYNFSFLECNWDKKITASLETDVQFGTRGKPKEVIWEGNCLRALDTYNTIWDTRVLPAELAEKGEFAGYTEIMGRVRLKEFINSLEEKIVTNIADAWKSPQGAIGIGGNVGSPESYFIPDINPNALVSQSNNQLQTFNWMAWAELSGAERKLQYRDIYEVTTLYARIIPSDFRLFVPGANSPQVWKFIIVNHSVLIYAERQTNAHNKLPILGSQVLEDGLGYQGKSLAQNVMPIQDVTSALMNSVIAARRRAVNDRALYDPSRIAEQHINSDNPSAKIPVRPSAYGKPVQESVYVFPFRDDQSSISLQEIDVLHKMADRINGQNPARQGQFVKGNKTRKEFTDIMRNSNGRDQMTSLLLEAQIFTPLKEIIKINILQYQGTTSLYNRAKNADISIDPVELRKAVIAFKISDGLQPSEKLINGDTLSVAFQVIGSSPQLAAGYEIAPLFSYLMKTQGAQLKEFEKSPEQIAYEQAMSVWQNQSAMIIEVLGKAAKSAEDIKQITEIIKLLPPQPKPADYGYAPQNTANNSGTGQAPGQQVGAQNAAR